MKNSVGKLFVLSAFVWICVAFFFSPGTSSQSINQSAQTQTSILKTASANWFCDERWNAAGKIFVGIVKEIKSAENLTTEKRAEIKAFFPEETLVNALRIEIEKTYKGAEKSGEIEVLNFQTDPLLAIYFQTNEKYLFFVNSRIALKNPRLKPSSTDPVFNFIRSDSKTKPVSESTESVAFFEKNFQRNMTEELLGSEAKNVVLNGIVSGKAIALVKPRYPEEAKKDKASGMVKVALLVDESGQVIKAKAICPSHPAFAQAAEEAALKSKFSPLSLKGKAVKFQGVIVYNFVP